MKVFLDANGLFSAAYRPGNGLLRLWPLPSEREEGAFRSVVECVIGFGGSPVC
jgi:hypothetical protein